MLPSEWKTLRRLLDTLRENLSLIRESIDKKTNSTTDQKAAEREAEEQKAGILRSIAQSIESGNASSTAAHQQDYGQQSELISAQRRTVKWTAGACIAAAVYATIAAYQGCETHRTYVEIQKQTTLMRQQLEGTVEAVIPRMQPWPEVLPDDIEYIRRNGIILNFQNIGKVPARDFVVDACFSVRRWPSYALIGKVQCKHDSRPELRPYEQNLRTVALLEEVPLRFNTDSLTKSDLEGISAFNEGIEVQYTFQYDNGFNRRIKSSLTFFYVTFPAHIDGTINPIEIGGGKGWVLMDDEGKRRVTEALKWKNQTR